jgi:hypothetical protein
MVMPLPVDDERTGADHDLHTLVPMLGPVVALDRIGGAYRVHGTNAHARAEFDLERARRILRRTDRSHASLAALALRLGCPRPRSQSVTVAAQRLVSVRMDASKHPIAFDTRWRALAAGLAASRGRFDVHAARRGAYAVWFLLTALAPRRAVPHLSDAGLQSMRPASP